DPFYRKAIRVSMGSVFTLPIVRAAVWPGELRALKDAGLSIVGAVLDPDARSLGSDPPSPPRFALLLGAEGPGLSAGARGFCRHLLTIPMPPGADSLNVATAGAIFLYQLCASR